MGQRIKISKRFNGPPHSGNGGYACGLLAKGTSVVTEVTLHNPPPLEVDLDIIKTEGGIQLIKDDLLIANAKPGVLDLELPEPPSFEDAGKAAGNYIAYKEPHIFPSCFVCGPHRSHGDGLRIFTGRFNNTNLFAASWIPDSSLADDSGFVETEVIWASLDCPGSFSLMGDQFKPMLLGRMTCELLRPVRVEEQYVIVAWPLGVERRKHYCGTAIYNSSNQICAKAKAVWISIDL